MAPGDSNAPKRSNEDDILDPSERKYSDSAFQKFESKCMVTIYAEYDFNTIFSDCPMLPLPGPPNHPNPFGKNPFAIFTTQRIPNVAPIDFILRTFLRVQACVRLVWLDRVRDMCVPILRAPDALRIHEAHCFNLGNFRFVYHEEWDPKETTADDLCAWLFTRMTQDEGIRSMVRYAVMLLFFEHLTVNGATGVTVPENQGIIPRRKCEIEERWFCMYFTDSGISDEDIYILKHLRKHMVDQKSGTAIVGFEIFAQNEHQVPTSPRDQHGPHCHCFDPSYNHFVYDAKNRYTGISGRGSCRMPVNPAVILADDPSNDHKHNVGCCRNPHVQLEGGNTLQEVPRENDEGKPIACGTPFAKAIPDHVRSLLGYMKYCMDLRREKGSKSLPVLPASKVAVLSNGDALYIRKDLSPNAEPFVHFM
ncbi:hypothetical protein V8F33_003772 [Rhypophila sp. PSN 637]